HPEQFLNALDVFVLNSHSEGMSNTILEAMACGLPVVATPVGANPMLIANGETGYLVADRDIPALASALTVLASDRSLRQTMGNAGRCRVVRCFSIEKMVQEYSEMYHSLHRQVERAKHLSAASRVSGRRDLPLTRRAGERVCVHPSARASGLGRTVNNPL